MVFQDNNSERAEAYRVLADLFSKVPDEEVLKTMKEDFGLESKETADAISTDFISLFEYPDGKLQPVESLYIQPPNNPSAEVNEFYNSAGLTIDEEFHYIPDHLSLEFLFMSYLIDNNMLDLQKIFLEEHIMNWVPYYGDRIKEQAQTVFYREIAEITMDFLTSDYEEIIE